MMWPLIVDPLTTHWVVGRVRREVSDWLALPWPSKLYDLTLWGLQIITLVVILLAIWLGAAFAGAL